MGEKADLCLINTCSVAEVADHKCRQAIHRMGRNHPDAFVVVTGCYAQLEPYKIGKIEGVDLVLGANEKANLIQFLSDAWSSGQKETIVHAVEKTRDIMTFAPSCSRETAPAISEGSGWLRLLRTYCTIPFARGFAQSQHCITR